MGRIFKGVLWVVGTIAFLAIAVPVVGLVGIPFVAEVLGPSASQNFRLSIVIDDNGREVVGSTVFRVRTMMLTPTLAVTGERVVADLGDKGFLFVAGPDGWGRYAELHYAKSFCITSNPDSRYEIFKQINRLPEGSSLDLSYPLPVHMRDCKDNNYDFWEEDRKKNPLFLIRFRDFSDPSTVERVDPLNLEATYGPGVRLVRIRLETTSAPISRSMEPAPEWLRKEANLYLENSGTSYSADLITGSILLEMQSKEVKKRYDY